MAGVDSWVDFEQIRHNIKNNTVDRLKQILTGLNDECGTHFSKSGKKQEIIDRIVAVLDSWRAANYEDRWAKAKAVVHQVRNLGAYTPNRLPTIPSTHPPVINSHTFVPGGMKPAPYLLNGTAATSGIARYDPYAPPRKPSGSSIAPSTSSGIRPPSVRFKESPFFKVEQGISSVVECPESSGQTDRRQQTVTFTLNNDQITKLKQPGSKYQLRLFCTSSAFYQSNPAFRTNNPCLIEFPPTCEVRVNGTQLTANLKGLKKKPGTAPPPDLGKFTRLTGVQNRVEMVYVNSIQPVVQKKYYLIVMLVETTSVETLVNNLRQIGRRSSHDIKQQLIAVNTGDDDIVAGPQKMSLKCPLSFMRVSTPCRSSKCVHAQCFDATSWFSMMEQTTTWLCPVCEKTLDYKDLIIDGYFDEILKETPESVEDVIVESDSEWHTSDNKFGSAKWKAVHPPAVEVSSIQKPPSPPRPSSAEEGKAKANDVEIFVLDSDDEDEDQVNRQLSPSYRDSSSSQTFNSTLPSVPSTQRAEDVIDLTVDSEDDGPPVLPRPQKRKASNAELAESSPTEPWKRGRLDTLPGVSGGDLSHLELPRPISLLNDGPTPPSRYPPYPTPSQPTYNNYSNRGSGSIQLPPLQPLPYLSRPSNSNHGWP
ncbi:uncharacterized protein LACBIDRAFT_300609 [Laccaria bicolor S238N-H82]|uniref:Predicted protein n=1 Tax=Laccaria bicolor (strain S238N-H82 / ATCC MYA-4686) TaxID=486041 RepID=B0CPP6_LACBS|nr:uncharacterized protein LACBIDRAFT_300609 [Laccaria bicolor S238N-H82]EDR14963.1 predicted protein [Laccaria bicolor S238N-H82]|eukprot:XP_001873171.1 predicted protein [Laccaria bicolor S238N-H82]